MGKNDSQKVTFYKYNIITGDYNIISEENIILSLSQSLLQDLRGLINGKGDNDTSLLYFIEINDNGVNFKQIHSEKYTIIKPLHIEGDNYYYAVKSVEMNTEYSTVIYRYNAATETSEEVIKMSVIAENIFISDGYVYMLSDSSICYAKLD